MNITMGNGAKWIWNRILYSNESKVFQHELVYFRRVFRAKPNYSLKIKVSADSRYRLFINSRSVSVGPMKGDSWNRYYEIVDVTAYLQEGDNVLAAIVLHLPNLSPFVFGIGGSTSITRSSSGGFLLHGILMEQNQIVEDLSTSSIWKCYQEEGVNFISGSFGIPATSYEHIYGEKIQYGWNSLDFNDESWLNAYELEEALFPPKDSHPYGICCSWNLQERSILPTYEIERKFHSITKCSDKNIQGNNDIKGLQIPPKSTYFIELDAEELMTAYFHLRTFNGKSSKIKVTYSECYEEYMNGEYRKGVRNNTDGVLRGDYDIFEPTDGVITFEPFWYRTFRYVRLDITTSNEELIILDIGYRETGYPLKMIGSFQSSDKYSKKLWDISIRTLKRCMFETFMDCPYYEQLQYIMDTRLQALYSYQISADDSLVRKAIEDFRRSLTPEGLLQSRYPSMQIQIIPGFSLHWIYMLKDHWMYYGDLGLIKRCRPVIDSILDWYDRKMTDIGLIGATGYWSFVDWVEGWDMNSIPRANRSGPMTIDTLMYIKALEGAAILNRATGRGGIADEYLQRASKAKNAILTLCFDEEKGLFKDGPTVREFSQHVQVWAVLSGVIKGNMAKEIMIKALFEDMAKMSYASTYFLCRALDITGLYDEAYEILWKPWKEMADLKLTTWVEDPVSQRSDCHGWGALPLYEFPSQILGVKPALPGYKAIVIKPSICGLDYAQGTVATLNGPVSVAWHISKGDFKIKISGPDSIPIKLYMPDKRVIQSPGGRVEAQCKIINVNIK